MQRQNVHYITINSLLRESFARPSRTTTAMLSLVTDYDHYSQARCLEWEEP